MAVQLEEAKSATKQCRTCGANVPNNAPFGHCPKCLLDLGFGPMPEVLETASPADGGQRFGDYELLEQLGRGGMGVVYKARQVRLNRLVALKMISAGEFASPMLVQRFHREAEAAANLHHPNIVPIYETGEIQGQHFFSMQLVDGVGLDRHIGRTGFSRGNAETDARSAVLARQREIARILGKVARAVDYAHQHGVLHRDIKPSNILLDARGEPLLTDFGVAKVMGHEASNLTASGAIMGTPSYMAPEQAAGDSKRITVAADVYSLGAILYVMLTGSPPFRAETPVETLRQVIEQDPKHPSTLQEGIDSDLATIAMKCLEKEPHRRYPTALALAEDLEHWRHGEPICARPIYGAERLWRWCRRNRAASIAMVVLLAGLTASLLLLIQVSAERDATQRTRRILIKSIDGNLERFANLLQPYFPLAAEELAALTGRAPERVLPRIRLSIGVLISKSPMETAVSYSQLLPLMERSMAGRLGEPIRLDLRIYRDPSAAQSDFLAGQVDLMKFDRLVSGVVNETNSGVLPLLRRSGPGHPTVVITRPDTGITNVAGLRGRTLGLWDRESIFSLSARAWLSESGLCQSNVNCVYLIETPPFALARSKTYVQESPLDDYDRTGSTVPALLTRQFDVVVCPLWQLSVLTEGRDWIRLGEFATMRSVWLGRSGLKFEFANAFSEGFRTLEPDEHSLLSDWTQSEPGTYKDMDGAFLEAFRNTVRQASQFDSCQLLHSTATANGNVRTNSP